LFTQAGLLDLDPTLFTHEYVHILRGPVASWDGVPCGRASPKLTLCTRHIHLICSTKKKMVLFQHYSNTTYFYTRIYSRINRP
jgi:hypothetical protein